MPKNPPTLTETQARRMLLMMVGTLWAVIVPPFLIGLPPVGIALAIGIPVWWRRHWAREERRREAAAAEHKRIWGW